MTRARCPRQSVRICTPTGGHNDENPTESGDPKDCSAFGDKAHGKYVEIIQFPISKTNVGTLELPPSTVHDLATFAQRFRDAGAILPKGDEELQYLLASVAKSCPPEEQVYEARTGWTEDRNAFVLVDGVIGDAKTKIIGVNRHTPLMILAVGCRTSGSWKSWRDTVAEPARSSDHLDVWHLRGARCSVACHHSIVRRSRSCLFGRTSGRKSIATLLGASVIGIARIDDLITWNIKDARLEERISEFNDALFPIDDLSIMRWQEKGEVSALSGHCIQDKPRMVDRTA